MSGEDAAPGYLIDTHVVLWAMDRPEVLSDASRQAILLGPNYFSVVSYWEVMVKSMKGTIDVGDPQLWWRLALEQLNAAPLMLRPEHITALHALPAVHKDPFDRILIAQAVCEGLTLVSADAQIAGYSSAGLKIVS